MCKDFRMKIYEKFTLSTFWVKEHMRKSFNFEVFALGDVFLCLSSEKLLWL